MNTPERKVKEIVKRQLTMLGCYSIMPQTGGYGNSGVPDFLVCLKGRFIAIECKAGKNAPSALQLRHIETITKCGGWAIIVWEDSAHELALFLLGFILNKGNL